MPPPVTPCRILVTQNDRVVHAFDAPAWWGRHGHETRVSVPALLTLAALLPFLLVSALHLLYAARCWDQYSLTGRWAGMLLLNILVLVPYVNLVALPALLVWLTVALLSGACTARTAHLARASPALPAAGGVASAAAAPPPPRRGSPSSSIASSSGISLSLSSHESSVGGGRNDLECVRDSESWASSLSLA